MSIDDPEDEMMVPANTGLGLDSSDKETISAATEIESQTVDREGYGLSAERSLAENNVLKAKLCGVCNENEAKYKCTRCYLPYCSIACSNLHKVTHPAIESAPTPKSAPAVTPHTIDNAPRPGTVAAAGYKGPFAALDHSTELQALFKLYPKLPSQLNEICSATLQPIDGQEKKAQRNYPQNRGKSQNNRKGQPWNQDQGLQNGVQALSQARRATGKDGEGVREFSKLVLHILSGDSTVDAAALIQKELTEENARIISSLLNGEV